MAVAKKKTEMAMVRPAVWLEKSDSQAIEFLRKRHLHRTDNDTIRYALIRGIDLFADKGRRQRYKELAESLRLQDDLEEPKRTLPVRLYDAEQRAIEAIRAKWEALPTMQAAIRFALRAQAYAEGLAI